MDVELALHWQSEHAGHHDRHFFAGIDPAQTDLPAALAAELATARGGERFEATVTFDARPARLEAQILAVSPAPSFSAGYQPVVMALHHGLAAAGRLESLAHLREPFPRADGDDAAFYARPRLVDHLDRDALARWRDFHAGFLAPGMAVLDLMASHDSHLPESPVLGEVVGLGMNAAELAANPRLTDCLVHDLNARPTLPFAAARFDLVLCALSIEYLTQPVAVLSEVARCLKPGGQAVISFSERWFPPKAVAPWAGMPGFTRVAWVIRHLYEAGFRALQAGSLRGHRRPGDDQYAARLPFSDPLYAISGRRV